IELSSLNGSSGFVINGIDSNDNSGRTISNAGDVNGDGFDDVMIGAATAGPNGNSNAGETYVVFGGTAVGSGGIINLSSLNGNNGFVLNGIDPNDYSGASLGYAGDLNNDGLDDIAIGAIWADPNGNSAAGESYIVYGATSIGSGGTFNLSSLNGTNGFVLNGIDALDNSGTISHAGDVDGDGLVDVIVGASYAQFQNGVNNGEAYIIFGDSSPLGGASVDLSTLQVGQITLLNGPDDDSRAGYSVSDAGDINGDGFGDVIVGSDRDRNYVVFGNPVRAGSIDISALDGGNGFVITNVGDVSGHAASRAGDVNGDGFDDIIVGAVDDDYSGAFIGESYVLFGGETVGTGGLFDAATVDGSNGFVIKGSQFLGQLGSSVSYAGDVNGDGIDDIIIGAPGTSPEGKNNAGASYVVFGVNGYEWSAISGGQLGDGSNWIGKKAPEQSGHGNLILRPDYGGTITFDGFDPSAVIADRATLGAEILGSTTLQVNALLVLEEQLTIESSGRLTGQGSVATNELINQGEIFLGDGFNGSLSVAASTISNSGLIHGVGRVSGAVTNNGSIEALDQFADLAFDDAVNNTTDGLISVRESLVRFRSGLTNHGQFSVALGDATIIGNIDNASLGKIAVGGESSLSILGDLAQNGTLSILEGSRVIVFDRFSGLGGSSGTGTLEVLGEFTIGASPGCVEFGGNLELAGTATTVIEVGGTAAGEYDKIFADGSISLDGDLIVELWDFGEGLYQPILGDTFNILTAERIDGQFVNMSFPTLDGSLSWNIDVSPNRVTLSVVPEPSSLASLMVAVFCFIGLARRSCSLM
ncbi:MAG: integrin alpha, partial [Planctomycetota bacterium]